MRNENEIIEEFIDHYEHRQFYEELTLGEQVLFKDQIKNTLGYACFALCRRCEEFVDLLFEKGSRLWKE